MNNQQPLIRVTNVRKSFITNGNRVDVLQGVDLDIYEGEMVAIVGASGVGKSTLLHVLGTLERPDHGEIFYRGESVFTYDEPKLASFRNQTIGFVFQFHHLLPEFNALENTMMPALIKGVNAKEACEQAEAILSRVGLENRLRHNLDARTGESIHDLLISLNRDDGITAAVVTHNMELAEKLSRRVTLVDGKALSID
jgi:lipoprotein-releasing system ATP-binding protein